MKIIDAVWEKRNLGVNTLEIEIEDSDIAISKDDIKSKILDCIDKNKFQYYVLKFDTRNIDLYMLMDEIGFRFAEVQFDFSICKSDFLSEDHSEIERFNSLEVNEYNDEKYYDFIISKIDEGIFATDRIALDPYFGKQISNMRYANWVRDLAGKDGYSIYIATSDGKEVGFSLNKYIDKTCYGLLGGVFKEYQSSGLGLFLHYVDLNKVFEKYDAMKTTLSSNNIKVINLWQYFSAKMSRIRYVYVKHI